jgi:hypothetical protein
LADERGHWISWVYEKLDVGEVLREIAQDALVAEGLKLLLNADNARAVFAMGHYLQELVFCLYLHFRGANTVEGHERTSSEQRVTSVVIHVIDVERLE